MPVVPGIGHYAAYRARAPMTRVARDPELMAEVVLASLEAHGYDGCGPITDYGLGAESMGSRAVIRDWEQTFVAEFALGDRAGLARLEPPDPLRDGRMPVILECEGMLVGRLGGRAGVGGGVAGPLSFAANLRGPERLLYDLCDDPPFAHSLLRLSLEASATFAEAQVSRGGVATVNVYEPLAALISPAMADEFSFPYLKTLAGRIKRLGASVLLHICNDSGPLITRMVEAGADILSLDAQVDLARAKELAAGRAVVSGNVATQSLARLGTEAVYAESRRALAAAARGGRFTLSSSCEVPMETPAANIDAMVRAARDWGAGLG